MELDHFLHTTLPRIMAAIHELGPWDNLGSSHIGHHMQSLLNMCYASRQPDAVQHDPKLAQAVLRTTRNHDAGISLIKWRYLTERFLWSLIYAFSPIYSKTTECSENACANMKEALIFF